MQPLQGPRFVVVLATLTIFLGSLYGCVYDGLQLPAQWEISTSAPSEPVPDRSVFVSHGADGVVVYNRFVKVGGGRYAWEVYAADAKSTQMLVLEAAFVPLSGGWHLLHWRPISGEIQGAHIVRSNGDQLLVTEITKAETASVQRAAAAHGVRLRAASGLGAGFSLDADGAERLVPFAETLTRMAVLPTLRLERAAAVPTALRDAGLREIAGRVAQIDAPEVGDRDRAARMLAYFRVLHGEGAGLGSYGFARFANNGWGMAADPRLARELAHTAVARGVPRAHTLLGYLAYFGLGQPADSVAAVRAFRLGAQADDARAYHGLGLAHLEGKGVTKDVAQAARWFEKAAAQGLPLARIELAQLLILGEGVPRDDNRAVELLDAAAAAGAPRAYEWRAWMHAAGRGGPKDEPAAARLYLQAARLGLPLSQWQIGERLIAGSGTAPDREAGLKWMEQAAAAGQPDAARRLAVLKAATPRPVEPSASDAAFADAMSKFLDEHGRTQSAAASAARERISQLDRKGAQLDAEVAALSQRKRASVLRLRKLMEREVQLVALYTSGIAAERSLVAKLDELLANDLDAAERAARSARRIEVARSTDDKLRKRAQLVGKDPDLLGWRLPSGRVVLPRPDGRLVAVGADLPQGSVDTGTLPRPVDRYIDDAAASALVAYESSWSGAPPEDERMTQLATGLNGLSGGYRCDVRAVGGIRFSTRPSQGRGPPLAVDANHVLRYRSGLDDGSGRVWHETEAFIPLVRVDNVEVQQLGRSDTCTIVMLRCAAGSYCAEQPQHDSHEISTSAGVSIHFAGDAAARRGLRDLQELVQRAKGR